jgi:hypothetical protein
MSANRRLLIFVGLLVLLMVGGGLTSYIASEGAGNIIPGVLETTTRPEGSVNQFGQSQGLQFFLMIGFIVFNLVGAAVTGMAIFWFLNREVTRAKAQEPANHESVLDAVPVPRLNRSQTQSTQELSAEAETG